jgi:hypothetical protein
LSDRVVGLLRGVKDYACTCRERRSVKREVREKNKIAGSELRWTIDRETRTAKLSVN